MEQQKNIVERGKQMSRLIKYEIIKDGKGIDFKTAIEVSNYLDISVKMVRTYEKSGKEIKNCIILKHIQEKKNLYFEKSAEWNSICERLRNNTKKPLSEIIITCKDY